MENENKKQTISPVQWKRFLACVCIVCLMFFIEYIGNILGTWSIENGDAKSHYGFSLICLGIFGILSIFAILFDFEV